LLCAFVPGVVDFEDIEDEDDVEEDEDGAAVGFGAGADCCAATAIGRPNASARLASFFMTRDLLGSRCPLASIDPRPTLRPVQ
jgi:hypothetical protein